MLCKSMRALPARGRHELHVIDVAGGEKIPRKGVPGITKSDLLVINKTDLAPHVGASLAVMANDAARMRGARRAVRSRAKLDADRTASARLGLSRGSLGR